MISPTEAFAKYNVPITGLLHIGANTASEAHQYKKSGGMPVIFFEPIPAVAEIARKNTSNYPNMKVAGVCCSDEDGVEVTFNIANNSGQSSSILELGHHAELFPSIQYVGKFTTKTTRIDTFLNNEVPNAECFNCAVIDTQGADLKVLKGFGAYLDNFDGLYVEVSDQSLYKGGTTIREVHGFLDDHGFALMHLENVPQFYGNALFVRRVPNYLDKVKNALSVGCKSCQSSIYGGRSDLGADKGNDGDVAKTSFFHTDAELKPWWEVDLGRTAEISGVYIFDRPGFASRSESLMIELSDDRECYRKVFARQDTTGDLGRDYFVHFADSARYVRVRLGSKGYLHLRQVAVV